MADLRVKFGVVEFKNPVWVASMGSGAPWVTWKDAPEIYCRFVKKCYEEGAGGFITGLTTFREPDYEWRGKMKYLAISTRGFAEREGFISAAVFPDGLFPRSCGPKVVSLLKREFGKDMPIIANITGPGVDRQGWGDMALEMQQAGADMVELNLNTFMNFRAISEAIEGIAERAKYPPEAGVIAGMVPEVVINVVEGIKEKANIPIIIKIPPEMSFWDLLVAAPKYKQAGVAGVTASHCFVGVAPPKIYDGGKPGFTGMDKTTFWAVNGPWNRFGCYTDVAGISKYAPGLDVAACGGLVIPEHAIEVMMLGAKVVQFCSGILWNGVSFISQVIEFMNKYMDEQGYKSVDDFTGLGLNYLVELEEQLEDWHAHPFVAQIDYIKCTRCRTCLDNFCWAMYWEDGRPKVNTKMCMGCGLCSIRCPSHAVSMKPVKPTSVK